VIDFYTVFKMFCELCTNETTVVKVGVLYWYGQKSRCLRYDTLSAGAGGCKFLQNIINFLPFDMV
jgi:hypothetical protein